MTPAAAAASPETPQPAQRRRRWGRLIGALIAIPLTWFLALELSLWRGTANLERRAHDRALHWLQAAHVLQPRSAEVHFLLARCWRRLSEFDKVEHHLRRASELGWNLEQLEREQWLALAQTGQYDEVNPHWAELFSEPGSDGPEICKAFVTGALSLLRLGDAQRVLIAWEHDFPDDPEPHFMRGRLDATLLSWTAAVDDYGAAVKKDPGHDAARFGLAQALIQLHRFDEAEEQLRYLLRQNPARIDAQTDAQIALAECLLQTGGETEARELLEAILEQSPDHADALLEIGRLELAAEHPAEALVYLEKAISLRPENTKVAYAYAKALRAIGRTEDAQVWFGFVDEATKPLLRLSQLVKRMLESPDNLELRFEIGQITWMYKSRSEGANWFLSLLRLDPTHLPTLEALAEHYRLTGDLERAQEYSQLAEAARK